MNLRCAIAVAAVLLVPTFSGTEAQQAPAGAQGRREGQAGPGGERGRGRGGGQADPFAGQPRINMLVVSGGCCHDYPLQGRLLIEAVSRALPVDWTVAVQGGRGTLGRMPIYARADWSKGYDLVIHNECLANVDDPQSIRTITAGHRGGPPAVVIHCAMHSYRAATIDDWREFLGVTSRTHTKPFPIPVKVAAADHPVMRGFKDDWVTPVDELYILEKVWPSTTALATARSPEDQKEYALAWVSDFSGVRVFGTTLGHNDETWADPVFQDLLVRGIKWALRRE